MNEPTILIVDDCIEEIRILVSILRSEGYRIILANSGRDGIVRAAYFKPNLILLDVTMPIMDGFAVCRRLKADPQTADIPIVFLTGANDIEDPTGCGGLHQQARSGRRSGAACTGAHP